MEAAGKNGKAAQLGEAKKDGNRGDNPEDCPVCLTSFDDIVQPPSNLPCGHTVCTLCMDKLKEQGHVTCPECHVSHAIPEGGQFPVSSAVEALIRRMSVSEAAASVLPTSSTEKGKGAARAAGQKGAAGLSKKMHSFLQEQEARVVAAITDCQELQLQLDQYQTTLTGWGEQQQHLEDNLQGLVDQIRSSRGLVRQEESRVAAKKEEVKKGELQLHATRETLRTLTTDQEVGGAASEVFRCTTETEQVAEECQESFPDVDTVTTVRKTLGCNEVETLEPCWVRSVLASPGWPRQYLLMWVFAHLCPSEFSNLSTIPPQGHPQKILQSLISMGICLPGDLDIVEGSASEASQIKFWKICLDTIQHLQNFSQPGKKEMANPQVASMLLTHLAHSPHLLPTLKGNETSLVPEDLMDKYHAWCRQHKHTPISESLKKVENQLHEEKEKYKPLEKWEQMPSTEEHQDLQASVEAALSSLTKQQEVLQGVYTTYIAPWTASDTQLELPTTGPLVEQANSKLSSLVKDLKATEEILQNCEKLEEQERAILKETQHPSSITTTLHSLVAE